jgi:kinesin family protein 2/24
MSDKLAVGIRINIQRSDGRVHDALVTSVNNATRCITVEWFERGETKGKEVDFAGVFAVNPELQRRDEVSSGAKPRSRQSEKPSQRVRSPMVLRNENLAPTPRQSTPAMSQQRGGGRLRQLRPPQSRQIAPAVVAVVDTPQVKQSNANANARRKSHCVKEVEKIRKQREERRAKQADAIQQRKDDGDIGHPNWEFLHMIREFRSHIDVKPLQMSEPVRAGFHKLS